MTKPSRRTLRDRFHQLFELLFQEVDQVALKKEIDELRRRNPQVPREKLAKRLVDRAAVSTALIGAGAGAPGGALGMLAMAPDIFNLVRQQSRLVLSIAFLYDQEPGIEERFREVLATLAVSTGASVGRQGVRYLVERGIGAEASRAVIRKIAGRFIARKLPVIAPVVGSVAGASLNYFAVQATGRVALEYYSRLASKRASPLAPPPVAAPSTMPHRAEARSDAPRIRTTAAPAPSAKRATRRVSPGRRTTPSKSKPSQAGSTKPASKRRAKRTRTMSSGGNPTDETV